MGIGFGPWATFDVSGVSERYVNTANTISASGHTLRGASMPYEVAKSATLVGRAALMVCHPHSRSR